MAGRAVVVRDGEDRLARRDHRDSHLVAGALYDLFRAAEFDGRQKLSVRQDIEVLARSAHADHLLDVGVVRGELLIADRPVFLDAFQASLAEIAFREAEAGRVPVDAAPAHRADAVNGDVVAVLVADR